MVGIYIALGAHASCVLPLARAGEDRLCFHAPLDRRYATAASALAPRLTWLHHLFRRVRICIRTALPEEIGDSQGQTPISGRGKTRERLKQMSGIIQRYSAVGVGGVMVALAFVAMADVTGGEVSQPAEPKFGIVVHGGAGR